MLSAWKDMLCDPLLSSYSMTPPSYPDRPCPVLPARLRPLICIGLWMFLFTLGACATAPQVGVRAPYQGASVATIAIVPFYALSSFSFEDEEFDEVLRSYEEATIRWLNRRGFEVIDSRVFQHHLTELGVWQEFQDGVLLRETLTSYFEPALNDAARSVEVHTLRRFAEQGWLPAPTLFFGELVYHTTGECRVDPRRFTSYAQTQITREAPGEFPRPCVTSHFQAKLVNGTSGHTMWYNRMLLETHSDRVDAQLIQSTIAATVQQTLGSHRGLDSLVPAPRPANSDPIVDSEL